MKTGPAAPAPAPEPRRRVQAVLDRLAQLFPLAETALVHGDAFQLLVATVLSAQTTDRQVNLITPALFSVFPDARTLAAAPLSEVEARVRSVNYNRTKAQRLIRIAQELVARHAGEVPRTMAELTALPGVGRKTANVVLSAAFAIADGIVVDTHVRRLANRLGFTNQSDPVKIEQDLMALLPRESWNSISHRLIFHGRATCLARRPRCGHCSLIDLCPSATTGEPPRAS